MPIFDVDLKFIFLLAKFHFHIYVATLNKFLLSLQSTYKRKNHFQIVKKNVIKNVNNLFKIGLDANGLGLFWKYTNDIFKYILMRLLCYTSMEYLRVPTAYFHLVEDLAIFTTCFPILLCSACLLFICDENVVVAVVLGEYNVGRLSVYMTWSCLKIFQCECL